ncbi:putative Rhodanese-like domain, serine hydrolase FSH, rhodanase, alpha/Beta hydrolase [Dioscorea sansibarensis]
MAESLCNGEREGEGVLLYYKYADVPDVPALASFYESHCRALGLLGRVRVAPHGVNVTIGGKMSSLRKHIAEMRSDTLFDGTDFKLASCDQPSNEKIAKECGFTDLSVRIVKELVTLSSKPSLKLPEISNVGRHLSAMDFHSFLQDAAENAVDSQESVREKLILLDARNLYETRIGKFKIPNVETLDPEIRQYSDLPTWIDEHSEQLRGKQVLMYCTGGIRCEMASAYVRSKGVGFDNVFQLFGGIQRYLEQFPNGGYFKGKNFVFDHRISVRSLDGNILGACLMCHSPFDDYSTRCRCMHCRMLVLVCYRCQGDYGERYVCELCQRHCKEGRILPLKDENPMRSDFTSDSSVSAAVEFASYGLSISPSPQRKLRILCLHGFRQNASSFKGRTSSLAKKLKSIVEFTFIDAPHELPFIYQEHPSKAEQSSRSSSSEQPPDLSNSIRPPSLQESSKKRFAWLVASNSNDTVELGWRMADKPFDPLQYQQQTSGFEESYSYIRQVVSRSGPFDGILGFSQGAAMAALICEKQQRNHCNLDFKFAILCSGFSVCLNKIGKGSIKSPSLHIFGHKQGQDRQIGPDVSSELIRLFDECAMVIEHDLGHIIPARSPYIDQVKEFLVRFI